MIVGVVSFSDPLMLAGLLAAGIPVALHLLHQIRSPVVPFPTLRFLKITAQKTSRRRHVQHYLLLLLRMAVFAMIAMAVAHPLIRGGSSTLAYGFIAMLLGGMGLLVLAAAWGTTALDKRKSDAGVSVSKPSGEKTRAIPESKAYWGLSTVAFVLALLMAGYAVFGLTSHTYFSGDKGEFSGHSTAAVIVLDDSHSMLAQEDGQTRLEIAKRQVRSLLVETLHPAQAAILATNPGLTPTTESLTADMNSLIGALGSLQPTGRARPMKERIHAGVDLLMHSTLPNKMLIVLSDCAKPAFADAEVFSALKPGDGGTGKDIQVVIMPMGRGRAVEDVGIASLGLAEGSALAVVGGEVTLEAQVLNNGDAAVAKELELLVDGNVITSADTTALRVQLSAAGTGNARATLRLPYRLSDAGPHVFTLRVKEGRDAMVWDDERSLVLDVSPAVKVLVVGAEATAAGARARSAAFFFQAALAPFAGSSMKDAAGKPMPWPIEPVYRGAADIRGAGAFDGVGAVFLCDLPKISPALGDALATYAQRGGRVVWILGPSVNGPVYNQVLVPRGLLPAPLGEPLVSSSGATIDWVDLQSDIFANLFESQEPFRSVVVTGRWSIGAGAGGGRALVKLADNSVVLTEHHVAGAAEGGDIYTLLTSPAAAWSNLGSTVLLVPMAARMALGDSGHSRFATSDETGDSLFIPVRGVNARMAKTTLDVTLPNQEVLNVRATGTPPALPQWYFDRTQEAGVYRWRSTEGKLAGMFVVNPPGEEVDLSQADPNALAVEATTAGGGGGGGGHAAMVAHSAEELLGQLQKRGEGTTLAPGILGMVVILTVLEALLANRYRPSGSAVLERGKSAAASPLAA